MKNINTILTIHHGRSLSARWRWTLCVTSMLGMMLALKLSESGRMAFGFCLPLSLVTPVAWSIHDISRLDFSDHKLTQTWVFGNVSKTRHTALIQNYAVYSDSWREDVNFAGYRPRIPPKYFAYLESSGSKYYLIGADTEEGLEQKLKPIKVKIKQSI